MACAYSDQTGVWEQAIPIEHTCSALLECGKRSAGIYPPPPEWWKPAGVFLLKK